MSKAKLLLVDDHVVVRQGLKALFANEPDVEIVGEAGNGREALSCIPELQPDVILMDISMPGLNGIEATRQIRQKHPDVKVVVLSMHANEEYVFQVLRAGASGYVLKQSDSMEVLNAIRAALSGGSFLFQGRRADVDIFQRLWIAETDAGGFTVAEITFHDFLFASVYPNTTERACCNTHKAANTFIIIDNNPV